MSVAELACLTSNSAKTSETGWVSMNPNNQICSSFPEAILKKFQLIFTLLIVATPWWYKN